MTDRLMRRISAGAAVAMVAVGWTAAISAAEDAAGSEKKNVFRAGAHAIDISPRKFPVIVSGGMSERTAEKIVDPLHARCLVLDDGTTQIAIVTVDSCVLPRDVLDKAKEQAHAATGIPVDRMLISATHCHSAPAAIGVLGSSADEEYVKSLPAWIAEGIEKAHKNLAPARVGWAVGKDPKNVFCRRYLMKPGTARTSPFTGKENDQAQMNPGYLNPNAVKRTGPADPDVTVLSVQTPDGRPVAVLGNYSTHYAGAPAVSADYFAVFCKQIGELIGGRKGDRSNLCEAPEGPSRPIGPVPFSPKPPFVGLMTNGTSGDANCCDFNHARRKFDRFTVGEDVARAAFDAYKRIKHYDWVPLVMEEKRITLDIRVPKAEEVAEAKKALAELKGRKPRTVPEVYARETVLLSEMPPRRELKLQAIRIGELGITAMPNEVYGSTGLKIKEKSPLRPTMNISLANGYDGYIPPPEQHKLGGYTTWRARSSCLEEQAEPKITAVVLELLKSVARRRSDEKPVPASVK